MTTHTEKEMSRDIFLSHAGDDASVAVEVCALLEKRGLKCWIAPRNVRAGAVWDEAILDAIEHSSVFLLILSASANKSQFVKNEVNRAFSQGKPIVTFRLEDVAPGRSLELYLARHHWTDAFPPPLAARVENLASSILALLDPEAAPAANAAPVAPVGRPTLVSRISAPLRTVVSEVRSLGRQRQLVALSAIILAAVIASAATWYWKPSPQQAFAYPVHLSVALPPGDLLVTESLNMDISRDGMQLVYVGVRAGIEQLYVKTLETGEVKTIPGTDGAVNPFFSQDAQWIGFFAQGKLKKVPANGGVPVTICSASSTGSGAWAENNTIIFSPSVFAGLSQVSANGGEPKVLTKPDRAKNEYSHRYPQILPGGKSVLYTAFGGYGWDESSVQVLRLDTGERRVVVRGGNTGRYLATGHIVYFRAGDLLAVPFDLASLSATTDNPVTIAYGVRRTDGGLSAAEYTVSAAGTLVYVSAPAGSRQFEKRLVWVDRDGKIEPLPSPPRAFEEYARFSPDGKHVAVAITSGTEQIWIYDMAQGTLTQITSEPGSSLDPVWSPDGKRLAYRTNRAGKINIYMRPSDGSGSEELLAEGSPESWSPDGKIISFRSNGDGIGGNIFLLPLEGDRKPQPLQTNGNVEWASAFSPDGHWIAYQSDESGGYEIYVQPYPGPGKKWQVSIGGGDLPTWNPKGHELFYRKGDKTMVVDLTTSPNFSAGKPRLLYEGPYGEPSPDGLKFLAIQPVEPEPPRTEIEVVLNWSEELKQKVPAGKN
jgi:serine/threonine-protein kinase